MDDEPRVTIVIELSRAIRLATLLREIAADRYSGSVAFPMAAHADYRIAPGDMRDALDEANRLFVEAAQECLFVPH